MKAIPLDTRNRILARYDAGRHTRQEVAEVFGVSLGLVKKILQQRRKFGHMRTLHANAGRKPKMTQERMDTLRVTIHKTPGLTLGQMREILGGLISATLLNLLVLPTAYLARTRRRYKTRLRMSGNLKKNLR